MRKDLQTNIYALESRKERKKTYTNKQFGTVGQQNKACLRRFILMKIRPGPSPGMHTVLPKYARCIDGDTGDHATRLLRFLSFETGAGLPFLLRRCASSEAASRWPAGHIRDPAHHTRHSCP